MVVAINKFPLDTEAEAKAVYESCKKRNVDVVISEVSGQKGRKAGGRDLAEKESFQLAQRKKTTSLMSMTKEDSIDKN